MKGLKSGQQVDQFRIVRELGKGGMSEVYLARDTVIGRKVALKLIRADFVDSPRRLKLFLHEARLTGKFSHPHIITIHTVGNFDGLPYLALEYLEGQTLSQRMREGPMSPRETMRIGLAIAQALEEAHTHGVLHRDLKPANVVIPQDGRLRVLDFGISKIIEDSIHPPPPAKELTREAKPEETAFGEIKGTPNYIAPERWLGEKATGESDVWALGVILFQILTQTHPYPGKDRRMEAIAGRIVAAEEPPPLPSELDVPTELSQLITKMLDRRASKRPTAKKVVETLQELIQKKRGQPLEHQSPFRGLLPFTERHADLFFGRNAEIEMAVERLRNELILPIVGPSGAGKSSFVAAGIVPRLRELDHWLVLTVRPGTDPFGTLSSIIKAGWRGDLENTTSPSSSLAVKPLEEKFESEANKSNLDLELDQKEKSKLEEDDLTVTKTATESIIPNKKSPPLPKSSDTQNERIPSSEDLARKFRKTPATLLLELQALADETGSKVLLFVDQLEELYTQDHTLEMCRAYMEAISRASDDPDGPIRVIFTLRDDFLGHVADTPSAREALSRIAVLRAPEEEALLEVLTKPVELSGYAYEDEGLPEEMLDSVRGAPASLPILQFACSQLWNRRNRVKRLLTRSSYDAMGGVEGALASEADELLAGLSEEQRKLMRQIMLRLVTPEGTRRVMKVKELLDGLDRSAVQSLNRLTDARLVVSRQAKGGDSTGAELELVHDSLIHRWKPLVRWLEQNREEVVFLDEVSRAAELWDSRGRLTEEVWSGKALDKALIKLERCEAIPNRVREFLEAGEVHRQARARVRRKIIFVGFGLSLTIIAALIYMNQQTETQRQLAETQREIAVTERELQRQANERQQLAHANSLREGARAAYIKGDSLEARSKLRGSLESRDSTQARALWWQLENVPLVWSKTLDSFGTSVSVSPNGRLIAASSTSIHLFDTKTLEHRILSGHKSQVQGLDFSPNGRYLSSGSMDGEIRLWDLSDGTVKVLKGHTSTVPATDFSPDGKRLVSGSWDKTINIWDTESTIKIRTLEYESRVFGVRFSPDGRFIISVHEGGKLCFWNAQSYGLEQLLDEPGMGIYEVAITADGKLFAYGGSDGAIIVRDLETRQRRKRLLGDTNYIQSVNFSSNGQNSLAATTQDGRVLVWDTKAWSLRHEFHHSKAPARSVSFLPQGKLLVSVCYDGKLKLWKLDTHSLQKEGAGHNSRIYALAFASDGKTIATGSGVDGELRFWEVTNSQSIRRIRGHDAPLYDIAINHNGKLLAAGDQDGSIRLYTYPVGQLRKTLYGHRDTVKSVVFSSDERQLLSASGDKTIAFWDLESLTLQKFFSTGEPVTSIDITPDGSLLASASPRRIQLRDIRTGQVQKTFSGHTNSIFSLAFSPDGKSLYSSSIDHTARRYLLGNDSTHGEVVARHQRAILWIDVTSITGDVLGTPSGDGTAKIWHIDTGEVFTLRGHRGEVNRLKFSPDGTRVATVSDDSTLRLWDTKTGRPLWHAPLMLEQPPTLLTDNGWIRFEDARSPSPLTTKWHKVAHARAKLASATKDRETLCLTTFSDELEIWNIPNDELTFKTKQPEIRQVLSIRSGCLTRSQDSVTLTKATGEAIPIAKQATAMSRHNDSVFVLQGNTVRIIDLEGNQQDEFRATAGASALTLVGNDLALGFPTGRIEIFRRDGESSQKDFTCHEPEGAPVTMIIPGPPGTIIAGFENGVLGIWSTETGERLFSHQLHGPVIHLLLRDQKLYAATELGSRVRFDLNMFYIDYCDLMDRVWREVFWVWEGGRARYRDVPSDHECRKLR